MKFLNVQKNIYIFLNPCILYSRFYVVYLLYSYSIKFRQIFFEFLLYGFVMTYSKGNSCFHGRCYH